MDLFASSDDISPNKRKRQTLSSSLSKRMKKARTRVTETFEKISSPRGTGRSDDGAVFGRPLNEVVLEQRLRLMRAGLTATSWAFSPAIPFIVSASIAYLRERGGISAEGIFRVSGFHESITKLRQFFNQGATSANFDDEELFLGCHEVAGVLKLFLRELPAPLITYDLYPQLLALAEEDKEAEVKVEKINAILTTLPDDNCHLLRELLSLLQEISTHSQTNCMGVHNLATVIGPAIMWGPPSPSGSIAENSFMQLRAINGIIKILELMISHVPSLTSLVRPLRPLPAEPIASDPSEEALHDSTERGLLRRLKRMSRSFHESPARNASERRRRPCGVEDARGGMEEWEKEVDGRRDDDEDCEDSLRNAVFRSLREKRFSLPVGHSVLAELAKEIDKEKLVCDASPTLTAPDEVAQMSPAVPPLQLQDKENVDNQVLLLTSPYRPSLKKPSPHPKKYNRTSLTVVRARTKKARTALVGEAFAEPSGSPSSAQRNQERQHLGSGDPGEAK